MRRSYLLLLVDAVSVFVAGAMADQRRSYNVYVEKEFNDLGTRFNLQERGFKSLMETDTAIWGNLQLDDSEASHLQNVYQQFDGHVAADAPAFFITTPAIDPEVDDISEDNTTAQEDFDTADDIDDEDQYEDENDVDDDADIEVAAEEKCGKSCNNSETEGAAKAKAKKNKAKPKKKKTKAPTTPYINAVPACKATIQGRVQSFLFDTYLNPHSKANRKTFKNVKVTHAQTGVAPVGCNPHSAYVGAIIFGNGYGVIRHGLRSIFNIPVFTCGGSSNSSAVYDGIGKAITQAKNNTANGIASVLNWSVSGGGADPILRAAITEAVKYMFWSVSAGNEAGSPICTSNRSPWDVPGVSITGGTTQPGDVTAYFTNCGACVTSYCPSTYKMFNGKKDEGTSFAAPIKTALIMIEADKNPKGTNADWEAAVTARTTQVLNPDFPCGNQNIPVFTKAKVCPT